MPAPRSKPVGAPVWIELGARDPDTAEAFYRSVLGVGATAPNAEFGGYRNLTVADAIVAGVMSVQPSDPAGWFVYLTVEDIAATIAGVQQAGGTVALPPMSVGRLGTMAWIADPAGNLVGLWQADEFPGTAVESEPGAPCWWELHTADGYAKVVAFYERALGWQPVVMGDDDEFRMVSFGVDTAAWAGIYDAASASDARPGWLVYFTVGDADEAAGRVRASGGTILRGPEDTPFGRMADARDPDGSRFCLMQLPAV